MKQPMIKYKGKLEQYMEMGFEYPAILFNVSNIPGLYNWMTLKELKYVQKILIYDKDNVKVYEGPITFERNVKYLMKSIMEFRPIEIDEKTWLKMTNHEYSFEFDSDHVIRSLTEIKSIPYTLFWSGNEDHEKEIELLVCVKGYPLYYKQEDLYFQTFEDVIQYRKKSGIVTIRKHGEFILTKRVLT